jgi:hypothetical protein
LLSLSAAGVLIWSNPMSGKSDGALVVYVFDRAMPAAIGKFLPHARPE